MQSQMPLRSLPFYRRKMFFLWAFSALLLFVTFYSFDQTFDMSLTTWQARDFLDSLFSGHPLDFYQNVYNKAASGLYYGHPPAIDAAYYSPAVYFFVGIAIFPIYLFDKFIPFSYFGNAACLWGRGVFLAIAGISVLAIRDIAKKIELSSARQEILPYFYLSSPILFLSLVICNQIDILPTLLFLYAFSAYLSKKMGAFAGLTALSVLFKPFALIAFFPLLLYREKRISRILLLSGIAVGPLAGMTAFCHFFANGYSHTQAVMEGSYGFLQSLTASTIPGGEAPISLFFVTYLILLAILFRAESDPTNWKRMAVLIPVIAYALFLIFVPFHTQWLLYVLPFLCLGILATANVRAAVILESAFSAVLIFMDVQGQDLSNIMRNTMLAATVKKIPETLWIEPVAQFCSRFQITPTYTMTLFVGFLLALLLLFLLGERKKDIAPPEAPLSRTILFTRSAVILLYILPPLLVYASFAA